MKEENVSCNIDVSISGDGLDRPDTLESREYYPTNCYVCGAGNTSLVQIDGGDCEDYIGRFLCRKHILKWREVEHSLSEAYVRLREILGALNPPSIEPAAIWTHTERMAKEKISIIGQLRTEVEIARSCNAKCVEKLDKVFDDIEAREQAAAKEMRESIKRNYVSEIPLPINKIPIPHHALDVAVLEARIEEHMISCSDCESLVDGCLRKKLLNMQLAKLKEEHAKG